MKEVEVVGTERRAKRTFRHIGIAVIHIASFLKGGGSMADCPEKPGFPGKEGEQQENCDEYIQALS